MTKTPALPPGCPLRCSSDGSGRAAPVAACRARPNTDRQRSAPGRRAPAATNKGGRFSSALRRRTCWERSFANALLLYLVLRLRFVTSTPLNVQQGSGTFVGIQSLCDALRQLGVALELLVPRVHLPVYTLERILFNETLRARDACDATVGFDLDGYHVAGREGHPHIAALKGVI